MIYYYNPGFELSYELKYGGKLSTQISAAYLIDCFHSTSYENYNGYRILLEEKRYFFKRKLFSQYFSIETGYYAANMTSSSYFVPKGIELGDDLYYESRYQDIFDLKRTGVIINVNYGMQFLIKHFSINWSTGFGFFIHNITHSNRLNPDDKIDSSSSSLVNNMMKREGKHLMPNLPLTLRFGYAF